MSGLKSSQDWDTFDESSGNIFIYCAQLTLYIKEHLFTIK